MSLKLEAGRRWGRALFRFLASLRLAVILLVVLIVATAIGTIYESRFDARIARAYVYEAPWFNAWIIFLGINLAAAAFSRYPWKKHHTGFVITHAGIITLLIGALIGRIWGVEGTMTLFISHEPSNRLITDRQDIRIGSGDQVDHLPVEIRHHHARADNPILLGTTATGWKLEAIDYADKMIPISTPEAVAKGGSPALRIKLWSPMGQKIDEWLWPDDPDNRSLEMGMLAVESRRGTAPSPASTPIIGNRSAVAPKITPPSLPVLPPGNRALIYYADDGQLTYYLQNKQGAITTGHLELNKPLATTWGDWQLMVDQVLPQAILSTDFKPVAPGEKISDRDRSNVTEGVKVRLTRGDQHLEEWFVSGWQMELPGKEAMPAAFGPTMVSLPISLELQQFDVERNEGTDTPAGFKSTILVRDASGHSATGSCSMNEPMNFPDSAWRRWTGLTYKISQASWNPQNLQQSSVQILLDPGWFFKWTGSLMVCIGIFTMFYLRPPRSAAHP